MEHEGFYYKINKTRNGKRYYVCATPNVYCKGTLIKMENGTIITKNPHTHLAYSPMFNEQQVTKRFRATLIERSKTETTPLKVIYDEESVRDPEAALNYSWPTAESSMRQSKRSVCPALPHTLRELGEHLDLNADKYQCNNSAFYQEWMVDRDGKYSVMFCCNDLISAVVNQGATELHADGTFKVVPSTPQCRQLFIIHLILQNHSIPVCYVLMEAKTEASYRKVLERFKIKYPEVRPVSIMIDFETALHQVFVDTYPEAHVYSCWFHYVQSLQKNIKKMGYSRYIQQNREAKMCLKMCAVLALLPAHQIEMGFQEIKDHAQNNGVLLPRFFTYMSSFWLTRKGPDCFSVYGQPRRTNNNVESFHSTLKQTFQVAHPNVWRMLDHLKNIAVKQHIVVSQLAAGLTTSRSIKCKYILNSMRIKNSTALLSTGVITIKEFLIQCSHCTDGYLTRELNWHDATDDSDDEIQNDDIPNAPIPAVGDATGVVNPIVVEDFIPVAEINIEQEVHNIEDSDDEIQNDDIPNAPIPAVGDAAGVVEEDFIPVAEVNNIEDYDDMDFIIPEDRELNIWQQFWNDTDEEEEIPFVEVPPNLYELYPPADETNICIVCRVEQRTHALVPCGHKVLCVDCVTQLQAQRCPLCNNSFNMALRIW